MVHEDEKVHERMKTIKHKILVLSGKGGVGKSTVAANIATALAVAGRRIGLLDIDVHGPSIPRLLGVEGMPIGGSKDELYPLAIGDNLHVMSVGFMLRSQDDAVIWRGPMKFNVIKQFLGDVAWGELDYLIVDSPPGTGDEPLSIAQLIRDADGAVIVTTPQSIALSDVRKCISFCGQLQIPVIGVVENMSGFVCPKCGERTDIFKSGGGERMAGELGVPFLGRVPIEPSIVTASDDGQPYVVNFPDTEVGKIFAAITESVLRLYEGGNGKEAVADDAHREPAPAGKDGSLRIALPVAHGRLSMHFGHAEKFTLYDVDRASGKVVGTQNIDAPEHEPGLLPTWLAGHGADMIIAGGMGSRARMLFEEKGIEVITGASSDEPEAVVRAYLGGTLATGPNVCDH
jgi:Mrp family chromosome partitioning ATPase/predicted Fe-Mo cluster-binding NifX family protein